jgi:hypothetical protein
LDEPSGKAEQTLLYIKDTAVCATPMRQLWQTSDWLLQNGPVCLYNFGRNLEKKLEWAEIRHNFASSIRTNDTSQN